MSKQLETDFEPLAEPLIFRIVDYLPKPEDIGEKNLNGNKTLTYRSLEAARQTMRRFGIPGKPCRNVYCTNY